jgi:hypothetical protein
MKVDIRTNFPQVAQALRQVEQDLASKVLARTLNRVVEQARTQMSRDIRADYNLPADYVRDRLRIRRAFAGAGQFSLQAELIGGDGKRRSANVIRFVRGTGQRGVKVAISKGRAKEIAGAFIGNKGRTVFRRTTSRRLPIEPVRTIDVAQMFNAKRINAKVVAAINERFPAVFAREMRFALSRLA